MTAISSPMMIAKAVMNTENTPIPLDDAKRLAAAYIQLWETYQQVSKTTVTAHEPPTNRPFKLDKDPI